MTISIDYGQVTANFLELFQHVRAGEDIAILENGVVIARLVPPSPLPELQHIPPLNAAKAFLGKLGTIDKGDIPIDLAENDEHYFEVLP